MMWSEAFQYWGKIFGRIVVRNTESNTARQFFSMKRNLRLGVQIKQSAGVAQQPLPFRSELMLTRTAYQKLASQGGFQLVILGIGYRAGDLFWQCRQLARP